MKAVAIIHPRAVRNAQVRTDMMYDQRTPGTWKDVDCASLYIGIFKGASEHDIIRAAAKQAGVDVLNVSVIVLGRAQKGIKHVKREK